MTYNVFKGGIEACRILNVICQIVTVTNTKYMCA